MEEAALKEMLLEGAQGLGCPLTPKVCEAFFVYLRELKDWNTRMNLTAIKTDEEIIIKHFLDSLTAYPFLGDTSRLLDIGSGAGFPGIPLKLVKPSLNVTLMDSVAKKVLFMRHISLTLGLGPEIEAVHARVEEKAVIKKYAGSFDCVISRAFTNLPAFLLVASPYLRINGLILAMKGPKVTEELASFSGLAGLSMVGLYDTPVPFSDRKTMIAVFKKTG